MTDTLDYYTIRQVYTEGYKDGETAQNENMFDEIAAVVTLLITKLGYDNLGELTKRELTTLVSDVNTKVRAIFNKQARLTTANIKAFMMADAAALRQVFKLTDVDAQTADPDRLWSEISNAPIAGVGIEPNTIMSTVLANILLEVGKSIKRAYADKKAVREFMADLVGTRATKYKTGVLTKLRRQLNTAVQTTIQHVSSYLTFKMGERVARQYTWVAILDSRTTDICRGRNGKVYSFADGPRPPAHWGCRSFIIPVTTVAVEEIPTFYTWVKRQRPAIQNEAIGVSRGRKLRKGELGADELPGFDYTVPLTASQYKDKLTKILTEVA